MKLIYCLLILLALPISPKAETVTLLEVDTVWTWGIFDAGPGADTLGRIPYRIDTIRHICELPEWLAALRDDSVRCRKVTIYTHDEKPHVDSALVDSLVRAIDIDRAFWRAETAWGMDTGPQPIRCRANQNGVRISVPPPRVDTVRIVDTVCDPRCDFSSHTWTEWDTVIVVDTVFIPKCQHRFADEMVTTQAIAMYGGDYRYTDDTLWVVGGADGQMIPDQRHPGGIVYDDRPSQHWTGRSKCIYCGATRKRGE